MSEKKEDYRTGYGHPPKANQFPPGQSGNPRGRPKGSKSIAAIFQSVLNQKVSVTENGKTKKLPRAEVMVRQLANEAMRGDAHAIKLLMSLAARYGDTAAMASLVVETTQEDRAILKDFLTRAPLSKGESPEEPKSGVEKDEDDR
jgi:hypothetical protein